MNDVLRVVLAEDHYLLREGTRRLLEDTGKVHVVASCGSAAELVAEVERTRPDGVVTDIRMPPNHHREGIDAAHEIRRCHEGIGVVVLSQYANSLYAQALFANGTAGLAYLLKDRVADVDEVLRALRAVVAGDTVIDPRVVEVLVARGSQPDESPLAKLTPRETDVLGLMAQGASNAGIMDALVLSESAVEKHISSIFAKLSLAHEPLTHRRVAAVLAFLQGKGQGPLDEP
jgi:DNA-binding NarL/FixJ family response regulator